MKPAVLPGHQVTSLTYLLCRSKRGGSKCRSTCLVCLRRNVKEKENVSLTWIKSYRVMSTVRCKQTVQRKQRHQNWKIFGRWHQMTRRSRVLARRVSRSPVSKAFALSRFRMRPEGCTSDVGTNERVWYNPAYTFEQNHLISLSLSRRNASTCTATVLLQRRRRRS